MIRIECRYSEERDPIPGPNNIQNYGKTIFLSVDAIQLGMSNSPSVFLT